MHHEMFVLAEAPGLGRVLCCKEWRNVLVVVGPVTLSLDFEAYQRLTLMLNDSAASLETLLLRAQEATGKESGGD